MLRRIHPPSWCTRHTGVCVLCGKIVPTNFIYCSTECSNTYCSSSVLVAASSDLNAQHSAQHDTNAYTLALARNSSGRSLSSKSSRSSLSSDEHAYSANRRPSIIYSRRPSATNERSTIPPLVRSSSADSGVSSANAVDLDPSFTIMKALDIIPVFKSQTTLTSWSSFPSPASSSSGAEQCPFGARAQYKARGNSSKRERHAYLPAYFSRLSVESNVGSSHTLPTDFSRGEIDESGAVSDHESFVERRRHHAQSYQVPRSKSTPSAPETCTMSMLDHPQHHVQDVNTSTTEIPRWLQFRRDDNPLHEGEEEERGRSRTRRERKGQAVHNKVASLFSV